MSQSVLPCEMRQNAEIPKRCASLCFLFPTLNRAQQKGLLALCANLSRPALAHLFDLKVLSFGCNGFPCVPTAKTLFLRTVSPNKGGSRAKDRGHSGENDDTVQFHTEYRKDKPNGHYNGIE